MADIWVNILGNASKLKGELDKAGKNVSGFGEKVSKMGKTMAVAGAAVTAAFTAIVLKTAQAGDEFDKMSLRTGVSVENLSSLAYASSICGSSIETLENSLRFMARGIYDTSIGIGEAKDVFEKLGISVVNTDGSLRSSMPVLKEVATKIAAMTNETEQAAYAGKIFGTRYGTQLMPLLKLGASGIEELMEKAEKLGITMTTEAATAAAEFTDRMTDLKGSLAGAGRMIGDTLIPAITPLIEKTVEIVGRVKEWVDENKPLVENIVKWAAGLGLALTVLGPILVILPSLIAGVTMLSGAFLPFAVTAGIVLGIKKLSDYLGDVKIKAFEAATAFKEWDLDRLNKGIAEFEKTIADLETELEEIDKPIKILGIEFERQDANIGRLKQSIKDWKIELGLLKEQKEELIKTEKEGIDVAEKMAEIDEEAAKITAKLTEEQTKQEAALKALAAEKELENAQTEISNRLYELTLTPMENQRRLLDELKESYEKKGIAQEIVNEWYGKEITELDKLNEKLEDNKDIMEEVARVTKAVENAIFELTHEPYEVVIKEINERYDEYIKVIKESTLGTLAQETAIRNINIARDEEIALIDKTTKAEQKAIDKKEELAEAYVDVKDKILELKDPRAAAIKALDDEKQRLIELKIEIGLVNEWYDLEIAKLGEVGTAFDTFETIAKNAIGKVVGYITDELGNAIYNLWTDLDDYEWSWGTFWEGLWDTVKRTVSNIIAKLLILIPILAIVAWFTGLGWAEIIAVLSSIGISFNKGGGVGYQFGGEVKKFQAGGMADTIPARLTVGEYVVAKPMVDFIKNVGAIPGNLIDAISKGLPTPAPMALAGGGAVGYSGTVSSFGETKIYVDIHDNRISDDIDIKRLAATVSNEILRKINLNRRH